IPAVLPEDFNDLREHLVLVRGIAPLVQIDVTDGEFVPDASWPYANDPDRLFKRIANEEEEMPYWQEFDFEVDLMVHRAELVIADWINAGARRVVPHIESKSDIEKIIADLRAITRDKDSAAYTEVGLAVNTTTPLERVTQWIASSDEEDGIDFVQCMGIEQIGYQGQDFDERVLKKITELRSQYPELPISVDGSVNFDTVAELTEAGATRLVVGSALFESPDIHTAIEHLKGGTMESIE
ncbi:MAG: hypothetical protein WEC58_00680, partial [Candidatus Paceibacterota bacterium]